MSDDSENHKQPTNRDIYNKLEEMDNKLERINGGTNSLNRFAAAENPGRVINLIKNIVKNSEVRAAILHLTKEEIRAGELAEALGLDPRNLALFLKPFLGRRVIFQRSDEAVKDIIKGLKLSTLST